MTKDHLRLLGNMGFLHLVRCFFLYVIGLFWFTGVVLRIIQLLVTKPRKFLAYKNRNTRPKCLDDSNFGSHNFTRSKVRGTEGKRRHGAGRGEGEEGVCAFLQRYSQSRRTVCHRTERGLEGVPYGGSH